MRSTSNLSRYVKWWPVALLLCCLQPAWAADLPALTIPNPPELREDVNFWIRVYSEVTTTEGLLHDERNLRIVYAKLKFNADTTRSTRVDAINEVRERYAASLRRVAASLAAGDTLTLSEDDAKVLALWGADASAKRLQDAARGIRFQLGQADRFRAGIVRSGTWETHIAESLANLGLPPELAALPHVESSFYPSAYSKVGAAGLWQFMPSTGRLYMRVDDVVDERLDPFRSTEAAAQLLSYNYRLLGTWPLALTAYNHGAAGMRRAVEAMGTRDFVTIARNHTSRSFGFASRNFYPSFLAALEIDRNPEKYFGRIERAPELRFQEVELPAYVSFAALERVIGVPRAELEALNPALRPPVLSGSRLLPRGYRLRLPGGIAPWTAERLSRALGPAELFAAQPTPRTHLVRRGDSLSNIAARYGTSVRTLMSLNGLQSRDTLRSGRVLRLPDGGATSAPTAVIAAAAASAARAVPAPPAVRPAAATSSPLAPIYIVRVGDTLEMIAARTGVSMLELMRLNRLKNPNFVFVGQRLRTIADGADEQASPVVAALERAAGDAAVAESEAAMTPPPAVSVVQTESQGPSVGPAGGTAGSIELLDLAVRSDSTIRVIAEETLGHYAEWLGVSAARLRSLNRLQQGQALLLGRTLRLDFSKVEPNRFEASRREFHARLQAAFFDDRRIVGTEIYIVRRGDTLWQLSQRFDGLPVWLLQQYNPDADLAELRAGSQLVVPTVRGAEETARGS